MASRLVTAKRLMAFLSSLEARLPPSPMKPNLQAVQRRVLTGGAVDSRSILAPRDKGWVPCIALHIPTHGMTVFLEDKDLDKSPAKLASECVAIIAKAELAAKYGATSMLIDPVKGRVD